ncbi:hypothetical protein [Bythopirellula goksoeyrii]|nr:hypothetical protein [Bythopirellula goksoeyrii]
MSSAFATILVNENFSHTDGDLVGKTPTPGPGAAWDGHSAAGTNPIQVAGGTAVINQQGGEDANSSYAIQSDTSTTYARFDFSLPASTNSDIANLDANGLYFAHFRGGTGTSFRARVGVLAPDSGGDFKLVLSEDSTIGDGAIWATELAFDTTYRVVTEYNASTQQSRLWLDPADMSSTNITATNSLGASDNFGYALRQSDDYNGQQIVDNLVVATSFDEALTGVPEPGSVVLMLCSLVFLAGHRVR